MKRLAVLMALGLLVAGCSGGDNTAPTAGQTTTAAAAQSTTTQAAPAPSSTVAAPSTTAQATSTATPSVPAPLAALAGGLGDVALLDVAVEGTRRPSFDWNAVDGAVRYVAVVVDESGQVLWAWSGDINSVTVGAGDVDREGVGAFIGAPGWLQVVGLDGNGLAVASSVPIPVG